MIRAPGRARGGSRGSILLATLGLMGCADAEPPAELVFSGGPVHTMDSANRVAEAVAVRGGQIIYVGDQAGVAGLIGGDTRVIELGGRLVLPGFIDTHVHPVAGGIEAGECDLNGSESRSEVIQRVSRCASERPESPWVRGGGFDLPFFPDGAPSRELLDSLVPHRPAYLTSADAHTAWVNTRALEVAGITAETEDPPPDGVIVRTPAGAPQGTLRESAMELVSRHLPPYTPEEVRAGLRRGLAMAASYGITTVHEANASEAFATAYQSLDEAGELTARAIIALDVDEDRGPSQVPDLEAIRARTTSARAHPAAAKIFLDGVIEGGTAALLQPYEDRPGWRGELNVQPDTLAALVAALDDAGFKVHIHAIGDRAVRVALDALQAQHERDGGAGPRHILAHIQLIDSADIPRFAATGAVASFQPLWFYADTYITELTEPRLGPERSRWLYPARSLEETGAIVAGGSDWSVSSMNPLVAMETAITRRDPAEASSGGGAWIPQETLDLETMIAAYTRQGALASDLENRAGTIEVGMSADLVVLDTNLFEIEPTGISEARVDLTVFEGRIVYDRGVAANK